MTKPKKNALYTLGSRHGMLTIIELTGKRFECSCECGGSINLEREHFKARKGNHCGCMFARVGVTMPPYWWDANTEFRGEARSLMFTQWLDLPMPDKAPYLELVKAYAHLGQPCRMYLRDPSKPATFDNIVVDIRP